MIALVASLLIVAAVLVFAVRSRRDADEAIAAEGRLRALAGSRPELGIGLVDRAHRLVMLEGLAGTQFRALIGKRIPDLFEGDRRALLVEHLEAALAGEPRSFELPGPVVNTVYQVEFAPFDADHVSLSVRDIGDELALRRSLEKQRHFLFAVLAQLGERVRVADASGRLLAFDGSATAEELHPLEWAGHFGLKHADGTVFGPHETPLLRALRGEQVDGVEVHVDGRSLVETGGPVLGPDGEHLGAVVVNADLTDFRNAEVRLRRSEERHRRVVESVSDCVFEADASGVWTHLSEAWTAATGYSVEDSLGRPCFEFVHPDDRLAHARSFAPLMSGERVALRHEHRFMTASGSVRWGEVQVRAISGWDGLPTGFVGVMRDVTGERRANQHIAAERAVMGHLIGMDGLEDAGPGLVEILGRELGWDGAELWQMADDEHLRRFATWTAPGVTLPRFMASGGALGFEVGDGFPGQAWMSRLPLWKADVNSADQFVRIEEGLADGICSTVALPLRAATGPVGVIVLVSRTTRETEPGIDRLLEAISGHITQFLRRREAERRAAQQAADLTALSTVAHELAGETDLFAARTTLCRAVRDLTDSALVVLMEPSGEDTLAVSAALGAAVRGLDVDLDPRAITAEAFVSGEPIFVSDVAADERAARCPAVAGATSAAWVPVVRDGHSVGVLAVGWSSRRSALSERDQELLRLVAAEAAITIHRTDLLARLQSTARTDPLTSLPNRRVWDEDLERELARARRHGGALCLAMLDLDKFKAYNDQFGHQAGDELLAAAATAWRPELRATDTIARFGGEEFAVLLPHSDEAGALNVVERLLAVVPFGQTASAGVAVWDGIETGAELLARADSALYGAKHAGRARALVA